MTDYVTHALARQSFYLSFKRNLSDKKSLTNNVHAAGMTVHKYLYVRKQQRVSFTLHTIVELYSVYKTLFYLYSFYRNTFMPMHFAPFS